MMSGGSGTIRRPHRLRLSGAALSSLPSLLLATLLPVLLLPSPASCLKDVRHTITVRLTTLADGLSAASLRERYYQVSNFSSAGWITIAAPAWLESGARFSESIDAARYNEHTTVAIVGAPHHRNKTGAVFRCEYRRRGHHAFVCDEKPLPLKKSQPDGLTRGMLLGASVSASASQDGRMGFGLYCGHLYRHTMPNSKLKVTGLCNLLALQPPSPSSPSDPLVLSPNCDKCQAGFSSRLMANNAHHRDQLLVAIGAPSTEKDESLAFVTRVDLGKSAPIKAGPFLKSHVTGIESAKVFYRGYAVDFANFTDDDCRDTDCIFVSTPRDLRSNVPKATMELLSLEPYNDVLVSHGQVNEESSQGFGLSVASLHFNGVTVGERSDFVVGEPYYRDPRKTDGVNVGRVLVYCKNQPTRTAIVGPEPGGQFGSTVVRVPDISGDKVDEFAVGCPYCDNGTGAVFLFFGNRECGFREADQVILGSQLMGHYSGSIPPLSGLGMSLSASVDVDGDGLNDLLIGAPNSNSAILARSRPYFTFSQLKNEKCTIVNYKRFRSCYYRFEFALQNDKAQKFKGFNLRLGFRFSFDSALKSLKRLLYKNASDYFVSAELKLNALGAFEASANLEEKYFKLVERHMEYQQMIPLNIKYTIELLSSGGRFLGNENDEVMYPWPRLIIPPPGFFIVTVNKTSVDCGNDPCLTEYSVELNTDRYPNSTIEYGSSNVTLIVHLRNGGPHKDTGMKTWIRLYFENGLSLLRVHASNSKRQPKCSSMGENIELCDISKAFGDHSTLRLQLDMDALLLTRPKEWTGLSSDTPPTVRAEVSTASNDTNTTNNNDSFSFNVVYTPQVSLTVGSTQPTVVDPRNTTYDVRYRERIRWQRIGPQITHVYRLVNKGLSDVYNITLNITTPVSSEIGDRLFYLTNLVRIRGNNVLGGPRVVSDSGKSIGSCSIPVEYLNPMNLTIVSGNSQSSHRVRRSIEEKPSTQPPAFSINSLLSQTDTKSQDRIACGEESKHFGVPRCAVIQCQLPLLVKKDVVRILLDGWLWSETMQKKYISDLEMVSSVHGRILGVPPFARPSSETNMLIDAVNQTTKIIFPNVAPPSKDQLPIWIYIVSVMLGILLLSLIILCLRKCGFFKRRRRPHVTECRIKKYDGSLSDIPDDDRAHSDENMLEYENYVKDNYHMEDDGSRLLLAGHPAVSELNRQQAMAPSSIDTGISEEGQSSASSPSQFIDPRDRGYESPSLGMSDDTFI